MLSNANNTSLSLITSYCIEFPGTHNATTIYKGHGQATDQGNFLQELHVLLVPLP